MSTEAAARRPRRLHRLGEGRRRHHPSRVPQRRAHRGGDLRHEGAPTPASASRRGGERYSAYFLRAKTARGSRKRRTQLHEAIARHEPRAAGPLARPRVELRHRHGDESRRCSASSQKNLLRYYEHMRREDVYARLRRDPAAGGAQPRVLREAEPADPDAARGARGRRRRGDLGHEDARHRRGVRQRDLDRQPDPARAQPAGRVDHLRHRRSTRPASRCGRASRSSATRRASSTARSPGASTRPTRW